MFKSLLNLLYPVQCLACGDNLYESETILCTKCLFHLPYSYDYNEKENVLYKALYGRVHFNRCSTLMYYSKTGIIQHLIHQLKYNGKKEVGTYLGRLFGHKLQDTDWGQTIDYVVPVPLHDKKRKVRGYNQSEVIAQGISQELNCGIDTSSLIRAVNASTQTKKDRITRWENVKDIYKVVDIASLKNKHILLIDDVITTGATIESCCNALREVEGITISIGCLAMPNN